MAMLPDPAHMDLVDKKCYEIYKTASPNDALSITEEIMRVDTLPMHCPYHHEVAAAGLWTAACIRQNMDEEFFTRGLKTIRERAAIIPGAFCGHYGTCGAGISAGIFAAVWMNTTPTSRDDWGVVNKVSAAALNEIASTGGPRCCKRVTYLSLRGALPVVKELMGLDLGECPDHKCTWLAGNKQCIGKECPFFPTHYKE